MHIVETNPDFEQTGGVLNFFFEILIPKQVLFQKIQEILGKK